MEAATLNAHSVRTGTRIGEGPRHGDGHMREDTFELSWLKPAGRPACLPDAATTNPAVEAAWRNRMIREAAYYRSQRRGAREGKELEDWLTAEKEIEQLLNRAAD